MIAWRFLSIFGLALCLGLGACSKSDSENPLDAAISVQDDDAEMNAAIASARATLPEFWKHFEHPGPGEEDFSLKTKVTDSNGNEHFWVVSVTRINGKISGEIDNDPDIVKSVKLGQRIDVSDASISDWMFIRNKKMVGNYTLRPLLKNMPQDQADELRAKLETP